MVPSFEQRSCRPLFLDLTLLSECLSVMLFLMIQFPSSNSLIDVFIGTHPVCICITQNVYALSNLHYSEHIKQDHSMRLFSNFVFTTLVRVIISSFAEMIFFSTRNFISMFPTFQLCSVYCLKHTYPVNIMKQYSNYCSALK